MLVSHGVPALRAPRLFERLRDHQRSSVPSSPASSISSTDPNMLSKQELHHLTDEESKSMAKGAQGKIYRAKYAGANCVVKRFTKGINRPEFEREVQAWKEFHDFGPII